MATDGGGATVTVKRGDLAIVHTMSRVAVNGGESYDSHSYGLHVVTSITRDGAVKALRELTSPDGTPVPVARMARHTMVTVPAAVCDLAALAQHVRTVRASDTGTGYVPAYTSPVEVLRDLAPRVSDPSAIELVRAAAFRAVRESIDFHRARCARCGIYTAGHATVATDSDGCPMAVCDTCPREVNFATDYPVGLDVEITSGFAQWQTARIESVIDHVIDGYYAGRSYGVTLAGWGARTLTEGIFKPLHVPAERYAVNRETSQPVEVTTAGAAAPVETSHTVPADGGDLAQPETSRELAQPATMAQPETSQPETSQPETTADGGDAALEAAQRSHNLRERARKAVTGRKYSGKPGDRWHLSEIDTPYYCGTYAKASMFTTDDGRAYDVYLFAYHDGSELARVTVKGLDSAFTNGERMADTAPAAPAAPAPAQPVEVTADGGEVDMPALAARLAGMGFTLAADGAVTDTGALVEERGGDSRGMLTHTDHAQLLTALGDRQGAAMMRAAGALEMPEIDEKTKEPRPRTAAQTAQLRKAIPAGVRGPAIAAVGDAAPAVRGAGTVETVPVAPVPAIGATVEVDGRRGRVIRREHAARVEVWRGAKPGDGRAVVFFPADGGASLPAPVEAQPETSRTVEAPAQPVAAETTAGTVTCPAPACGRTVRVTRAGCYGSHRSPNLCDMSGKPVGSPAPASRVVFAAQTAAPVGPVETSHAQPVEAPADGGAVETSQPETSRETSQPVAPAGAAAPETSRTVDAGDRVRVGFTAGAVVSIDGDRALVQLATGGAPHRVPVAACKPDSDAPAQPVESSPPVEAQPVAPAPAQPLQPWEIHARGVRCTCTQPRCVAWRAAHKAGAAARVAAETAQPVAPVASLADIAAASDGRIILATVGADGIRPVAVPAVETSRELAQPESSQPVAPETAGGTVEAQPETSRAAVPAALAPVTRDEPHLYRADPRSRKDSRNRYRCQCGATYDARRVHLTPRELAAYRAQREQESATAAPVVAPGVLLIEHTTDGGTVLRGTGRGDGTAAVMGRSGQAWGFSRNIGTDGAWYVSGSRGKSADYTVTSRIDRAARALAAAGYKVAVWVHGEPREVDGVPAQPLTVETTAAPVEAQRETSQPETSPMLAPVAAVEAPAQPAADGGEVDAPPVEASAAAPVAVETEPGVTYTAAWSPAERTVTVVRDVRGGVSGPFGDYPADSREAAAAVLAADGYAVTGDWEVSRLGDHWAPLARLLRPVVDFPMPAPYYAPGYAPADGATAAPTVAETSRELAPVAAVEAPAAQPETSQPSAEWLSPAQTAQLLRGALRESFPAVTFSVRCSRGSAVRVHWQDGPTEREVRAVTDAYRGADFDGMQDMKTYRGAVTLPDGRRVRFGADFIFTSREETEPATVEDDAQPVAPVETSQPVAAAPAVSDSPDYPHAAILRELARYSLAGRVKVTRQAGAWWYRAPLADGGEVAGGAVWVPAAGAWEVSEVARTAPVPAPAAPVAVPAVPDTAAAMVAGWAADRMPVPVSPAPAPAPVRPVVPSRVAAALARVTSRPAPAQPVAAPVAPRVAVAPVAAAPVVAPVAVPAAPVGDRGRYAYAPGTRVRAMLREVRRALASSPVLAGVVWTVEADRPTVAQPIGAVVVSVEAPAGVDLAAVWAVVDGIAAQHVAAPVLAAV